MADTIADWAATDGTVGIRIMLNREGVSTDPADPGINRVLAAAARHSLPVNLMATGRLEQAGQLAARNPNTQLVIDHLGLQQPYEPPPPAEPFADLPKLLALARPRQHRGEDQRRVHAVARTVPLQRHLGSALAASSTPSASIAACGAPTGRARSALLTYEQGVEAFRVTDRLSDSDRAALMGETLRRVYNWSPSKA